MGRARFQRAWFGILPNLKLRTEDGFLFLTEQHLLEPFEQPFRRLLIDPIIDVAAALFPMNQTRLPENPQVVGNGWLGEAELGGESADVVTVFLGRFFGQQAENTQSRRVADSPETAGQLVAL